VTRLDRWLLGLAAAAAAAPSLVRAAWSPLPIADDWSFVLQARHGGLRSFVHGADFRARPFQALLHWLTFTLFGQHLWLHLVLMAALNAAIALLIARIARRWLPGRMNLAVAATWAVLPNHSAARLWPATVPALVALLLVLVAAELVIRRPSSLVLPTIVVVASALTYEGGVALGAAALLCGGVRRRTVAPLAALAAVALWIWHASPKQGVPKGPFQPGRVLASQLGSALLPHAYAGAAILVVLAVLVALALTLAPGFRNPQDARLLFAGLVLIGLGVAPFVAARFPLSTDGLLDRGNTFASLGTAVVLVATGRALLPAVRFVRPTALAVACVVFAVATRADIRSAHRADNDARRVLIALHHIPAHVRLAVAPLPNHDGYSSFGYGTIAAASRLELRHAVPIQDSLTEREWRAAPGVHVRLKGTRFVGTTRAGVSL
jgi:hypothetical protein